MNKEQALQFLREHQPMPPDEEWTEELAEQYAAVRQYFINNPDPACIPLFLHSYGERGGLGLYQMVADVFEQYSAEEVIPHLTKALSSKHRSVRYWTAQICMLFADEQLVEPVLNALKDSDEDTRYFCYTTLGFILEATQYSYTKQLKHVIDRGLAEETDQGLIRKLKEIKEGIKKNGC
jgi:hypothetical protein